MNRRDVEGLVAVGLPDGLVTCASADTFDAAAEVHFRMLALLRTTPGRRRRGDAPASDIHQEPLISGMNASAVCLMKAARCSLEALSASRSAFACELDDGTGEPYLWRSTFDDLVICSDQLATLRLVDALAVLPPTKQMLVARVLSLEQRIDLARIHLHFATEDQGADEVHKLQMEVAALTAQLQEIVRSPARDVEAWLLMNRGLFASLRPTSCVAPAALPAGASSSELLEFAAWYQTLGDSMYKPLPLDEAADGEELAEWRRLWDAYEQCGRGLLVLACWARAMGSSEAYLRCDMCFRHRGGRMRHHCQVHKRTALKRIPRREDLVAREYRKVLGGALQTPTDVEAIAQMVNKAPDRGMVRASQRLGLPTDLSAAALKLGVLLRWLYPLLSVKLRRLIAKQFHDMLRESVRPFKVNRFATDEERTRNHAMRRLAIRNAHWDRFFGRVFASEAGWDIAIGAGRGHPIDIDHPLSSTNALISERKLVSDLQRFDAWIAVDFAIDKLAYLDESMVFEEFQRQQEQHGRKPTLRELGSALSASPETIRKRLLRASGSKGTGPSKRRYSRK